MTRGLLAENCPRCLLDFVLISPGEERPGSAATGSFPRRFGDYELLEEIARGGMGVVYRARQLSLNREVALKMVLAGEFAGPEALQRFRREAETAARLQHRHIVAIHETGEVDGQPYLTMDFVDGRPLSALVRDGPLPSRQAARYLESVAAAVHFAHTKGVLHRDLKPSNILIDAFDEPRITDFGLAQPLDRASALTCSRQALGTPGYMAPEQVGIGAGGIGVPADVYGLGALLYHLLTGRPPFQGDNISAVLLQMREDEPVSPRRLNPGVPTDLDTICLKCLQKEPGRRYGAARDLAEELGRFQRDEPIQARPISGPGRLWRLCRRRPAVATLSVSVLLLVLVVALGSSLAAWRLHVIGLAEHDQRERAERANRSLQETVSLLELQRAERWFTEGDGAAGTAQLARILRRDPSNAIAASRLVSALVHRPWALPELAPVRHADGVVTACFSPDGRQVLSASWDGTAQVRDAVTGTLLATLRHGDRVLGACYSPDGERIVTTGADGTAHLWYSSNGAPCAPALRHAREVHRAEFSPDGRSVVTACADPAIRIWDSRSGDLKREIAQEGAVLIASFSPEGARVATGTEAGFVRVVDVATSRNLVEARVHRGRVTSAAFSPDGRWLASTSADGTAQLWNLDSERAPGLPLLREDPQAPVWHACFSPDGALLLTCGEDGRARLWEVARQRPIGGGFVHGAGVRFGTFSPDGHSLVTASADHTARLWELATGLPRCQPLRMAAPVVYAAFSPDSRRLVAASLDNTAQIWDVRPGRHQPLEMRHASGVTSLDFSPDGQRLLTTSFDRMARCWDARTGRPEGEAMNHATAVNSGEFSADGERLVTACADGKAMVWDPKTQRVIAGPVDHRGEVWSAHFSPDGSKFVTASADGTAQVWDTIRGSAIGPPLTHQDEVLDARFSPDGRWVATASKDRSARLWEVQTGNPWGAPLRHEDQVNGVEFSRDGTRLVTASRDDTACVWLVRTGERMARLPHLRIVQKAVFSPEGRRVATGSLDRTARIWDADSGRALTPPLRHESPVSQVRFSSDGRRLLTGTWNGVARVWDSNTGEPLTEWLEMGGFISSARFDPVGRRIAVGAHRGQARVWEMPGVATVVPEWFSGLAEAVAGVRWGEQGGMELVPREELLAIAGTLAAGKSKSFYAHLARWVAGQTGQPGLAKSGPFLAGDAEGPDLPTPLAESIQDVAEVAPWVVASEALPAAAPTPRGEPGSEPVAMAAEAAGAPPPELHPPQADPNRLPPGVPDGSRTASGSVHRSGRLGASNGSGVAGLVQADRSGNVGVSPESPTHRLGLGGGSTWTSNGWLGALFLEDGAALGWEPNAGGHAFGMGHTGSGFYLFRTGAEPGTTSGPALYDLAVNNAGNVGIGTWIPEAKLHVAGDLRYDGTLHKLDVGDSFSAVVRAGDFAFGHSTRRGEPGRALVDLYPALHVNHGDWPTTILGGEVGIGLAAPKAALHVENPRLNPAIRATATGPNTGLLGESTSTHPGTAAVLGRNRSGFAMAAEGDVTQDRDKGGWVKAMVYVDAEAGIVRCFNSLVPGQAGSTPDCGFRATCLDVAGNPQFEIRFPFEIHDRFLSVTTESSGGVPTGANYRFGPDPEVLIVNTFVTGEGRFARVPFMLIVF